MCTLSVFLRLGATVIVVTSLSLALTIVVLPAMLAVCGPPPVPCWKRLLCSPGNSDPDGDEDEDEDEEQHLMGERSLSDIDAAESEAEWPPGEDDPAPGPREQSDVPGC